MNETASKLPKYPVVMAMKGVGTSLGPQLMAEIGDKVILHSRLVLHVKAKLTVHGFELIA